ncbi:PNDC1 ribonuclease, partial [Eudromia elegans]|nr:PNDC1 ribonuclease [Eudromia elegans]
SLFDSPAEWYQKARQSVQRFTVSQFGKHFLSFCCRYVVHSYNFFLFPSTFGAMDPEFTLSASSIQFLSHYGFDYNKFLKDGIPYMNEVQEESLRQYLLSGSWKVYSVLDKESMKKAIDEVTCWIAGAEEEETMILQDLSGFQMFEVQLVLRRALQNVWTQPLGDNEVMVKKVSLQHRRLLENSPHDSCQKELILTSARGFTNLFQALVKAKKPLVGHNMLMDLLHLHDKFYKPLPESYEEFKRNIHSLFPVLIDTKAVTKSIWKNHPFPRVSSLLEVYEVLCSSDLNPTDPLCPEIVLASGCSRYAEKSSPHEAGYDAFLCGSVLLKAAHLLLCGSTGVTAEADPSFSQYLDALVKCLNQVHFTGGGVASINFSGVDVPCRCPPLLVVRVQGWRGLNERHIYHELKSLCHFRVKRLSEDQFILQSHKFKHTRLALRHYKDHPHLQISLYRHWRHSPHVSCLLQVSSIVALWSLVAFILGGAPCQSL